LIERHEVSLADFSNLRRNLRSIIVSLNQSDNIEALDLAARYRILLSEWLTVPIPFDEAILDAVRSFGDPAAVEMRWGHDIRLYYDAARQAADNIKLQTNPIRHKLLDTINDLRAQKQPFKIYCHRLASTYFESLLSSGADAALGKDAFLHTVKDYREAEPFDVLIKVGPLRAKGWGWVPDAILTAPRFVKLVQIVWTGCADESDFGYDPVATSAQAIDSGTSINGIPSISRITFQIGKKTDDPEGSIDVDEFQLFRTMNDPRDKRRATLIQIPEAYGILYPPHSQVLSFAPDINEQVPIMRRLLGETLVEGMFIIMPILKEVDLGGLQAEHGYFSRIWKERLAIELAKDKKGLIVRLRGAGLDLLNLRIAIKLWLTPPTTVIHAPQQASHFEILIKVLGIDFDDKTDSKQRWAPWWQYAWNEIRRSRGEAIQAGVNEQEKIEEELMAIIDRYMFDIRSKALTKEGFVFQVPAEKILQGDVLFLKVYSVEEGFAAPDTMLKRICELSEIEQWRA
jgi:hypothetical protein